MLIVVTGVRGAGKTTLIDRLGSDTNFLPLTPSTTRPPRDPNEREYDFRNIWDSNLYAWEIDVGGHKYGMRKTEIEKSLKHLCITVFEPLNFPILKRFAEEFKGPILTIGLDTVSTLATQHQRVGGAGPRQMSQADFDDAREVIKKCDVVLTGSADKVYAAVLAIGGILSSRGGIVVKDEIVALINAGSLLLNADITKVRSASYDLHVGNEAWCQGRKIHLDDRDSNFEIPPYSYAIVSAREVARFPPFVTGRFDVKVSLFFDGVILSNGPQVDPGYHGALFCMLFNGNSVPRGITRDAHFATIEFSTTTQIAEAYKQEYQFHERLDRFMNENTAVSPGGNIMGIMDDKFRSLTDRITSYEGNFWGRVGAKIAITALVLSAVAVPGGIILTQLWDRVKTAEDIVSKMKENEQGVSAKIREERDASEQSIREAKIKALEDIAKAATRRINRP